MKCTLGRTGLLAGWLLAMNVAATLEVAAGPQTQGWSTIKGRIIFDGTPPTPTPLKVEKDTDHCLSKGAIPDETWVVDPASKGVRWVAVFLKPAKGKTLAIHDSLKNPPSEPAVLDQPLCRFVPRTLAMRAGQKLQAKNPDPIPHNVVLSGVSNAANVTTPAGKDSLLNVEYEPDPVSVSCGAHPWMRAKVWVFKHPYFAVTDAQGRFEITLAPSGPQQLVIWHEAAGFLPNKAGQTIEVKAHGETDLGEIKIKK